MTPSRSEAGADLQSLVDDLAGELGRSVVVNDPVVRMLCTSRHFGDEDEVRIRAVLQRDAGAEVSRYVLDQGVSRWTGPGVVLADPGLGLRARLCVPLRADGELLGLLMVIDADRTLTGAEIALIEETARAATAVLHRDSADEPDRTARARVVAGLLDEEPARRRDGITGATAWIADSAQVVVTVVEGAPAAALRSGLDSAARRDPRRCLTAVVQDTGVLVRTGTHLDPVEMAEQAERMVAATVRLAPGSTVTAGIGEAAPGLATAWRSGRQARAAARGARTVPGLGPVTRWTALGPYTPLLMLPDGAVTAALVPEPVERLLAHRKAARLVPTLRTFLDTAGSVPRTAEVLHLHRTSLYYRLEQITEITGLDLDDGGDRLVLHLGLLAADLLQTEENADRTSARRP